MTSFVDLLKQRLGRSRYRIGDDAAERLREHWELLIRWNRRVNLTSIVELEEAVVRHYCESVALAQEIPAGAWRIVDWGSGAGFPGFVLAIVRPECQVVLVERDVRKSIFLEESVQHIRNVQIAREGCNIGSDWIVSRGVAWRDLRLNVGSCRVGLLISQDQQAELDGFTLQQRVELPWAPHHLIVLGELTPTYRGEHVSRGTS
jgi:hypothetical protein